MIFCPDKGDPIRSLAGCMVSAASVLALTAVHAQSTPSPSDLQRAVDAERQVREREQTQQRQLQPAPDVWLTPEAHSQKSRLPNDESPCFRISQITLGAAADGRIDLAPLRVALSGPDRNDAPEGRCLGAKGVAQLIERVQDALIDRGFVTSRILAAPQDLSTGTLKLQVMPGRIERIRLARPDDRATLRNALPMTEGDVLQLRDLEQALENFKRVPTAEVDMRIEPGSEPGLSDLVINWAQRRLWRLNFSADDSGSQSSGKYQGSATVSYDNALTLNDLFYLTFLRDLGGGDPGRRGTRGIATHYSVPFGYWLLGFNSSRNRYYQTVAGLTQTYLYSGISHNQDIRLTRLLHRDAVSKTSSSIKAFARQSNNFIDDTEVQVQRRRVGGYELALQHKAQYGSAQIEAGVTYKRGTRAFGANQAPEELFGEGTHQFRLVTADAQLQTSFAAGDQRWLYHGNWRLQRNRTPLTAQDRFSIGSRYTVRGFDGISGLSADRGWLVRNEISTALAFPEHHAYIALDHGRVGGSGALNLVGQRLTGLVLGLRGRLGPIAHDLFVGSPVSKPGGFRTASTTYGWSLSAQF